MCPNAQFPVDLITFTEEILNGKLHVLCSVSPNNCLRDFLGNSSKSLDGQFLKLD